MGDLHVLVAAPIEAGQITGLNSRGLRRIIPITGGTLTGPSLQGRILPGGADDAFLDAAELDLRVAFGITHVTLQVERAPRGPCAHAHA